MHIASQAGQALEEKGILKDLAESQILKDTEKSQTAKIDQSALQSLAGRSVTLSTIMPVAYNPTDIRVLSFSVEIQLSNTQSAKRVREASRSRCRSRPANRADRTVVQTGPM